MKPAQNVGTSASTKECLWCRFTLSPSAGMWRDITDAYDAWPYQQQELLFLGILWRWSLTCRIGHGVKEEQILASACDPNDSCVWKVKELASAPRSPGWPPPIEGTPAITSHHDVTMKAPVWRKNSSSTSCWNISSLDCQFGWERLSFSAGASLWKAGNVLPVLATLCGWGSIMCLKIFGKSTQVLVQSWKAQLGIVCGQEANHYRLLVGFGIWRHTSDHLPPCNNEGTSLEKEYLFDFLLKHLKLRLSVWLGKTELLSWHSICKACSVLPVLATLCGWGSIMCFKYFWQKALKCWWLLVQCWKARLDIVMWARGKSPPLWCFLECLLARESTLGGCFAFFPTNLPLTPPGFSIVIPVGYTFNLFPLLAL